MWSPNTTDKEGVVSLDSDGIFWDIFDTNGIQKMWSLKNTTDNKEDVVGLDSAAIFWDLFETSERQKM